jgi:hypothetical protein
LSVRSGGPAGSSRNREIAERVCRARGQGPEDRHGIDKVLVSVFRTSNGSCRVIEPDLTIEAIACRSSGPRVVWIPWPMANQLRHRTDKLRACQCHPSMEPTQTKHSRPTRSDYVERKASPTSGLRSAQNSSPKCALGAQKSSRIRGLSRAGARKSRYTRFA